MYGYSILHCSNTFRPRARGGTLGALGAWMAYLFMFFIAVCVDVLHVILCKLVFLYGVRCGL